MQWMFITILVLLSPFYEQLFVKAGELYRRSPTPVLTTLPESGPDPSNSRSPGSILTFSNKPGLNLKDDYESDDDDEEIIENGAGRLETKIRNHDIVESLGPKYSPNALYKFANQQRDNDQRLKILSQYQIKTSLGIESVEEGQLEDIKIPLFNIADDLDGNIDLTTRPGQCSALGGPLQAGDIRRTAKSPVATQLHGKLQKASLINMNLGDDDDDFDIEESNEEKSEKVEAEKPPFIIPELKSVYQPPDADGFLITPGGLTSIAVKLNAIYDEDDHPIPTVQLETDNSNLSKWTIVDPGILFLAGTDYFAYVCYEYSEKAPFYLGLWSNRESLANECNQRKNHYFYFLGWREVKSTPKLGAAAGKTEIRFDNSGMMGASKKGYFGLTWPDKDKEHLYHVRHGIGGDPGIKLPRYTKFTIFPEHMENVRRESVPRDDRYFFLYKGEIDQTGNPLLKGWGLEHINKGYPIQLQLSVAPRYPYFWYLTEIEPNTYPFGNSRSHGTEAVTGSLETYPKPGIWWYNFKDQRIYAWGTSDKFLYTCREPKEGGAILRVGTMEEAKSDCKSVKSNGKVYPLRFTFELACDTSYRQRAKVFTSDDFAWLSPAKDETDGYAYNESGDPTVARLITLGSSPIGMNAKERKLDAITRKDSTIIIEAFVIQQPGVPYVQRTVYHGEKGEKLKKKLEDEFLSGDHFGESGRKDAIGRNTGRESHGIVEWDNGKKTERERSRSRKGTGRILHSSRTKIYN